MRRSQLRHRRPGCSSCASCTARRERPSVRGELSHVAIAGPWESTVTTRWCESRRAASSRWWDSDGDGELAPNLAGRELPHRIGCVVQWVLPVHSRVTSPASTSDSKRDVSSPTSRSTCSSAAISSPEPPWRIASTQPSATSRTSSPHASSLPVTAPDCGRRALSRSVGPDRVRSLRRRLSLHPHRHHLMASWEVRAVARSKGHRDTPPLIRSIECAPWDSNPEPADQGFAGLRPLALHVLTCTFASTESVQPIQITGVAPR